MDKKAIKRGIIIFTILIALIIIRIISAENETSIITGKAILETTTNDDIEEKNITEEITTSEENKVTNNETTEEIIPSEEEIIIIQEINETINQKENSTIEELIPTTRKLKLNNGYTIEENKKIINNESTETYIVYIDNKGKKTLQVDGLIYRYITEEGNLEKTDTKIRQDYEVTGLYKAKFSPIAKEHDNIIVEREGTIISTSPSKMSLIKNNKEITSKNITPVQGKITGDEITYENIYDKE